MSEDEPRASHEAERLGPAPPVPAVATEETGPLRRLLGVATIDLTPLRRHRDYRLLFAGQALSFFGAMLTSLLMPLLLLAIIPGGQMLAFFVTPPQVIPPGAVLPPGLAGLREDPREVIRLIVPLMVTLGGLLVPSLAATYTVVSEREARTLDLLVALPVRMAQVLAAKLLAIAVSFAVNFSLSHFVVFRARTGEVERSAE